MPATKYGDCSAYLFMSRDYGVDYGDIVMVADYLTYNRQICRPFERLFLTNRLAAWEKAIGERSALDLLNAIGEQSNRFKALRAGTESSDQVEPQGVEWWTILSADRYIPAHS